MQTLRLKSLLPRTSFAPQWDSTIGIFQFNDTVALDTIRSFLIQKEPDILKLKSSGDAGTGLDDSTITSRYGHYNVFNFTDECPQLNQLLDWLRIEFLEFLQHEASELFEVEIVCWYNILRDNKKMSEHIHSSNESSYLSGNMQLSTFDTQTDYRHPLQTDNSMTIYSKPGQLVIFPSYLPHSVNQEYVGERISLAFDLYPTHIRKDWGNSIRFMDQDIFKRLTNK